MTLKKLAVWCLENSVTEVEAQFDDDAEGNYWPVVVAYTAETWRLHAAEGSWPSPESAEHDAELIAAQLRDPLACLALATGDCA